jgi:hypothetical protein
MATMQSSTPRRPPPPPPPISHSTPTTNGHHHHHSNGNESLSAAADLIRTLDSAFSEMSSLSASAAKDAEDARRNARAASEVARRYTARSFPQNQHGMIRYPSTPVVSTPLAPDTAVYSTSATTTLMSTIDGVDSRLSPNRKRKIPKQPPSSADRLAESHAEDVLTLSLELERTKHALERERRDHDHTRSAYTETKAKNAQLEAHMDRILQNMEQQREEHGRSMDRKQHELDRAQARMDAAEEDAQAAVDLATQANETRQQLEGWLQRSLEEVTLLRERLEHTTIPATPNSSRSKNSVRFAESPTFNTIPNRDGTMIVAAPPPPPPSTPSRSMVSAGRSILAASRSPESKMYSITLTPEKSAERRQRLRDRLKSLDEDDTLVRTPTPVKASPSRRHFITNGVEAGGVDMGLAQKAMEACHSVANVVRTSARQLQLPGRWGGATVPDDVAHVDNLTRRFCHSVEVRFDYCVCWLSFLCFIFMICCPATVASNLMPFFVQLLDLLYMRRCYANTFFVFVTVTLIGQCEETRITNQGAQFSLRLPGG